MSENPNITNITNATKQCQISNITKEYLYLLDFEFSSIFLDLRFWIYFGFGSIGIWDLPP
jgi:hypothetical protein